MIPKCWTVSALPQLEEKTMSECVGGLLGALTLGQGPLSFETAGAKLPAGSPPMESQKEPSQRGQILYDMPYVWNLKRNDTNELTDKEKHTHRLKNKPTAAGQDSYGVWNGHVHTKMHKTDSQQGLTV